MARSAPLLPRAPAHSLSVATFSIALWLSACGGAPVPARGTPKGPTATPDAGGGPGAGGNMPPPPPMGKAPMPGMGPMGGMSIGTTVVGVPTVGPPKVIWAGGGPAGLTPLAPGCTPASALECPTVSGTCATSASAHASGSSIGSICFYGVTSTSGSTTTTTTSSAPEATLEYLHETAGGQEYYRYRITFDPSFADNTYGSNAIGWGQRGHTYDDLVGSDHVELQLFDGTSALVMDMKLDYISVDTSKTCGYNALGVGGGEGQVLVGDARYVLGATTSLARDLNGCGYCANPACGGSCKLNSPATDARFTANASAPSWDFRVQYEVWIDAALFAGKGFGGANVPYVHASPSKAASNTIIVTPKPCPGGGGGGCGTGTTAYLTSEGQQTCVPTPGGGGGCPAGYTNYLLSEGAVCVPTPDGNVCPTGYQVDPTSEGARCI
jgi:hypothetical protein